MESIRKFFDYLFSKRSELSDLELKDAVLAKTVLDIHRNRSHKELVRVSLYSLKTLHELDRENT